MFPHEITVFREKGEAYDRYYVHGILWEDVKSITVSKSGMHNDNSLRIYIPFSSNFEPLEKDFVIKGIIDYQVQNKLSELFKLGDVRTITSVKCYDFGDLKHYEVGGK